VLAACALYPIGREQQLAAVYADFGLTGSVFTKRNDSDISNQIAVSTEYSSCKIDDEE